jgi:hypothetical protein
MRVERKGSRLRDLVRLRRRRRHPISASQVAHRYAEIAAAIGEPLGPEESSRLVVVDAREGWRVHIAPARGLRAQSMIWTFTPDGRLCRGDKVGRFAWDATRPENEIAGLVSTWSRPIT